ncbi:hypothetical protein BBJ28_00006496 [Nothophytophthora sp. Chile5]|nr:hypothetical protein BBJ28_00006496 [Nothophytophthora sp. Chile5]
MPHKLGMPPRHGGRTRLVLRALVAKNWTIKRRHTFATWSEVLGPLLCILLFAALKTLESGLEIPAGWASSKASVPSPTHGTSWNLFATTNLGESLNEALSSAGVTVPAKVSKDASSPPSTPAAKQLLRALGGSMRIPRFYLTEATMPGLLLGMSLQAFTEANRLDRLSEDELMSCALKFLLLGYTGAQRTTHHVPNVCQGKIIPYKIAVTPDTAYTREYFVGAMEQWYPRVELTPSAQGISLLTTPSFADAHVFFDNETALETYIASAEYGVDLDHPKVYAAIAFHEFPQDASAFGDVRGHSIDYSLRFNTTAGFSASVPTTKTPKPSDLSKRASTDAMLAYATRGFLTLQTAVARFLNCMPAWDAQSQSTNGSCQIRQAVMPADAESDRRLLRQVKNDMVLGSFFHFLDSVKELIGKHAAVNLSDISMDAIPAAGVHKLLLPLRMAPQPFHGAGVYASPTQAFHYERFFDKVNLVFPLGFVLSYLYMVSRVIAAFLGEKETRSRELMRILGAQDNELFAGWVLAYLPILVLGALLQTLGAHATLFPNSDALLLFVFFFTFATSCFGYGFLMSTMFSRTRAGSLGGMGVFFLMFLVSFSFDEDTSEATRNYASLLAPVSLSQGLSVLTQLESSQVGVTSQNVEELVHNFRFETAIWMQALDTLLHIVLGKYLEKVIPQEFGVAEKWSFFLTKAYWSPAAGRFGSADEKAATTVDTAPAEVVTGDLKQQEADGRAVVLANLRKEFPVPGGRKVAVHGLNLKLYEGQITCLLGHNGAGKTTVMSMLTGMTPPSSGDAWIRGYSVVTDMQRIRQSLGYCPQHSVLYQELTVEEHLTFYGRLKGFADARALAQEVASKMREMELVAKRNTVARALSGGMQRKLSLAIAFLGDSSVVFLDEPTAGMDPYSRRCTWDLIQRNRAGRVVILTTHFMDEADILGDRIAIMADGRLQCVGSSLFLKKWFGVGYRLSFVRRGDGIPDQQGEERASHGVEPRSVAALVQRHVVQAVVTADIGAELTFQLPFEAASRFPALFREVEARQQELGILSFAISVTTLEDVFLKVAESGSGSDEPAVPVGTTEASKLWETVLTVKPTDSNVSGAIQPASKLHKKRNVSMHAARSFANQMGALLRKRVLCSKRDFKLVFFSTVLPIVVTFVGLSALKLSTLLQNGPKLVLSPISQYPLAERTPVPFSCPGSFGTGDASWCSDLAQTAFFTEGVPYEVDLPARVYNASTTPTVFGVTYESPSIEPNDTSGYSLRFGERVFENGYGVTADASPTAASTQLPVEGQFGGYLLYASEATNTMSYNLLANGSSPHAAPTYKAMMDGAIHRFLLSKASRGSGAQRGDVTIRVSSHPLPLAFASRSIFGSFLSVPAVLCIVIAFTFIPAAIMPSVVKEKQREQNAKHQQLLSGVSLTAYWLANFVIDVALYLVPMTATLLLLRSYGVTSSLSGAEVCNTCTRDVPVAMVTLFALFGVAVAPWTYLLSHVMTQPSDCLISTLVINFFVGVLLLLASVAMSALVATQAVNAVLLNLWRWSPLFAFGNGLLNVLVADLLALFGVTSQPRSAFDADIAGTDIRFLLLQGPVFFVLAVAIDVLRTGSGQWRLARLRAKLCSSVKMRHLFQRVPTDNSNLCVENPHHDEEKVDEDVAAEAQRVTRSCQSSGTESSLSDSPCSSDGVQILQLQHTYPNGKHAVKDLSFGLQPGECFAFLGVNGAGKTTTMKVLTGDLLPKLQLQDFADKLAGSLSGGNKRKLSLAVAMLGDPRVLVLDEPSTGVDPFSRRLLWRVILEASVLSRRATVLLTTHSMEECEALCSKAGIMVDGRLRCFGSVPHLKLRFGGGFMLECKVNAPSSDSIAVLVRQASDQLHISPKQAAGAPLAASQLEDICAALGDPSRAKAASIGCRRQGRADLTSFCDWWLLEDQMQRLDAFLRAQFSGVALVERQSDFCRYKLDGNDLETVGAAVKISRMFEVVEAAKTRLEIKEYSLSQTSLEQIFNGFAQTRTRAAGPSEPAHFLPEGERCYEVSTQRVDGNPTWWRGPHRMRGGVGRVYDGGHVAKETGCECGSPPEQGARVANRRLLSPPCRSCREAEKQKPREGAKAAKQKST